MDPNTMSLEDYMYHTQLAARRATMASNLSTRACASSASPSTASASPTHGGSAHVDKDPEQNPPDHDNNIGCDDAQDYSDLDSSTNQPISSSSSERTPIDLHPADILSIAAHGHRTYHAHAIPDSSIPTRAAAAHALAARFLATTITTTRTSPTIILVVWGNSARATLARPFLKGLFGAALSGTYPRRIIAKRRLRSGAQPVAAGSPAAVLGMDRSGLRGDVVVVFAELPMPEDGEGGGGRRGATLPMSEEGGQEEEEEEDGDDDNDDDDNFPIDESERSYDAAASVWRAVAACAGRAGEAGRVHVLLDAGDERDRRLAPRLREMMRREGVEVPALVARIAEQGIPDPVDEELGAAAKGGAVVRGGDGDADEGYHGHEDGEDDGGVRL